MISTIYWPVGETAPPSFASDAEALAWYRATYDDDQASDDLVLARLAAWGRRQSLGPDAHGIPRRQPRPATPEEEALTEGLQEAIAYFRSRES